MKQGDFQETLNRIVAEDHRYDEQAYHFLREALDFTIKLLDKPHEGKGRHVSGAELLEGIRQFALKEYGPLALTVLRTWGITRCEDFGEVVFNMVQHGLLGKTDDDRREHFSGGYDFDTAFRKPFRPRARATPAGPLTGSPA